MLRIATTLIALTFILHAKTQSIVFGAGCFWGVEKHFENLKGVQEAIAGYAGGSYANPTYNTVLQNRHNPNLINHTETVKVVYDDTKISTLELIKSFWELHDPTQKNRQGNDIGNNYRSAIYYTTDEQKTIAFATKEIYQKLLNKAGYGKITTEIKPLDAFYEAEEYHQDYLRKNPLGYCPNHATGVKFGDTTIKLSSNQLTPLKGKEIIVIDAPNCPFCKRFKRDVLSTYKGSLPLRISNEKALKHFKLQEEIVGTPTVVFIQNGKEVFRHTGYMDPKAFYKALGAFKLGKESESYKVAFDSQTDRRFCKRYKKFQNAKDGIFIDKISGDALFDTRDRFDSGTGWLSFYRPLPGSVIEKEDRSYGMVRTEVVAKTSGAHLGHVFNDAPGGKRRFCINASVLEFIPREKIKQSGHNPLANKHERAHDDGHTSR